MSKTIIVGGGIIGLAVAWELRQQGHEVVLLERDRVGRSASWAAGGMLSPVAEVQFTEPALLDLGLKSLRAYPEFVQRLEAAAEMSVEYDDTGTLVVAGDADQTRLLQRLLEFQQSLDLPVHWLDGDECREREPMLSPRVVGGIHAPQDHAVAHRKVIDALEIAARRAGVEIHEGAEVLEILLAGDRVSGVRTRERVFEAPIAVLAAGAWSKQIDGLPETARPPVRPVRGQLLVVQMDPADPLTRHVIRAHRGYLVPRRDGRLLVGATSEERGFEIALTVGGIFQLLRGLFELLPGSYELPVIDMYAGLRPGSPDNMPILGPSPEVEGLIYATGHYRGGILLTPITAWAIARTVADGTLPDGLQPFAVSRFAHSEEAESDPQ